MGSERAANQRIRDGLNGARLFRKKPVEVTAIRYDGPTHVEARGNEVVWNAPEFEQVRKFVGSKFTTVHCGTRTHGGGNQYAPAIRTLEGTMRVDPGDWVIRGTRGEVYPCKPGPFEDTFEEVSDA